MLKKTRVEVLTTVYNEVIERLTKNQMAIEYQKEWVKQFKTGDPNRAEAMKIIAECETAVAKDTLYMQIIATNINRTVQP